MADRYSKLNQSNPFAGVSLQDLMDGVVSPTPPSEIVQTESGINAFWIGGFGITTIGIFIDNVSEDEWRNFIPNFERLKSVSDWAKADWCLYGHDTLGKSWEYIASIAGMKSAKSAEVYASIARNSNELIRVNSPSFSHVRKVLSIDSEELRIFWLQRAQNEGWSSRQLGAEISGQLLGSGSHRTGAKNRTGKYKKLMRETVTKATKLTPQERHELADFLRQQLARLEG